MSKKWIIIWLVLVFSLFLLLAILSFYKDNPILLIASEIVIPVLFGTTIFIINRLIRPFSIMGRSINMIREGDFNSTLVRTGNNDVDALINIYNSMINKLREERLSIREKNHFLDLLIESSPLGVVVLDLDERILSINRAAYHYLGIPAGDLKGLILSGLDSTLAKSLNSVSYDKRESVILADGRKYLCQRLFFMDHGFKHPFYIIEELTEEIRKAEKEAYGKLIRMMAHEVNNTIGSVNSIMTSVISKPDSFCKPERDEIISVLTVAVQRNYQMNRFMQNFSNVVKLPLPEKEKMDLNRSVSVVADSFSPAVKERNVTLILDLDLSSPQLFADQSQMEQVFSNIIKNSLEAIGRKGTIRITTSASPIRVVFEDDGPGINTGVAGKLFSPFFSTKPGGQGIGLTLTQDILSNHGFLFSFTNRVERGAVFTIHLENKL